MMSYKVGDRLRVNAHYSLFGSKIERDIPYYVDFIEIKGGFVAWLGVRPEGGQSKDVVCVSESSVELWEDQPKLTTLPTYVRLTKDDAISIISNHLKEKYGVEVDKENGICWESDDNSEFFFLKLQGKN